MVNSKSYSTFLEPCSRKNSCAFHSGFPLYFKITLYHETRDCLIYHGCAFDIDRKVHGPYLTEKLPIALLCWQFCQQGGKIMSINTSSILTGRWQCTVDFLKRFNYHLYYCLTGAGTPKYHLTHFGNSLNIYLLTRTQILIFWTSLVHTTTHKNIWVLYSHL